MEEMHGTRYMEREKNFHALSEPATFPVHPHVHPLGSSPNPTLLSFYWGFITQVQLIKSLVISDWTQSQASLPFRELRAMEMEVLILWSHSWLSCQLDLSHQVLPKSHLVQHNKRHLHCSYHLGNSKGFRSSVSQMWTKMKYNNIFILNYNST